MGKTIIIGLVAAGVLAVSGCGGGDEDGGGTATPGTPEVKSEFGRNVARIPGSSPADVAGAAILAAYPPGKSAPKGWMLVRQDSWQEAMLAAQFAADPVDAAIVPIARDFFPPASFDVLSRVEVSGFPRGEGLKVMVLGKVGDDVVIDLQDQKLELAQLDAESPARLASDLVPFRSGWAAAVSDQVVVASADARAYALPAAAWSAYSGDTLAYVTRRGVPPSTRELLTQREKLRLEKPSIYVVGPSKVIPESVVQTLSRFGKVTRIAGGTAVETAVAMARFRDESTGFGWGIDEGPANVSLVNASDWQNGIAALTFAGAGPQAPILLTGAATELPEAVRGYLRGLDGSNQGFVFGNGDSVSSDVLREFDKALSD